MLGDAIFIIVLILLLVFCISWIATSIEYEGAFTKDNAVKQIAAIIVIVIAMVLLIDELLALFPDFVPAIFR